LIVLATFCWAGAMHLFSAIPDIDADTKAKLNTTAIYLGRDYSLIACFLLWVVFAFIIIIESNINPLFELLTLIYPLIPLSLLIKPSLPISKIYWYFPWINNLLGFGLFVLLISKN
jgi:4-hydroxybenzoate polyprenyltransferase